MILIVGLNATSVNNGGRRKKLQDKNKDLYVTMLPKSATTSRRSVKTI